MESDSNVPQWKRELILRIRTKNKWSSEQHQLLAGTPRNPSGAVGRTGQQPGPDSSAAVPVFVSKQEELRCADGATCTCSKMVKERVLIGYYENGDDKSAGSSSEELHYGPGIVNKLKNRYLSLTLRESAKARPSILPMRKATSLEHLLDEEVPKPRVYRTKENTRPNRFNTTQHDLKRARSVETISRNDRQEEEVQRKHESVHEDMLIIKEGSDTTGKIHDSKVYVTPYNNSYKLNRPKRIAPIMSEKEKPPVDVVKQAKKIFEGRAKPTQQQTGEVAAKVATYKSIIGQNRMKPPIKQKPVLAQEKPKTLKLNGWTDDKTTPDVTRHPDISRIPTNQEPVNNQNLSETPDLILHSSPVKIVSSPTFRIIATDNFLKAEINHSTFRIPQKVRSPSPIEDASKAVSPESRNRLRQAGNTTTYKPSVPPGSHLPVNKDMHKVPKTSGKTAPVKPPAPLTPQEIEKNHINTAKTLEQLSPLSVKCEEVKKTEVPKTKLPREPKEQNSVVFKFTNRKDVPDYVGNDGRIRTGKIEKPKVGEGGIILLPGVTLDESLADDDEDWMLSLEGPPSPCDVAFINDNVLIDGRSSLSQSSKKLKMRISFVDSGPDVFEYPSEASLMDDPSTTPSRESSPGHIVPTLSGSSLANYIPKSGSTEDFQLGITRTTPSLSPTAETKKNDFEESTLQAVEEPVLFSAGTNSDILF